MAEIRITPAARTHLLDIWAYTEATWGEAQADAYLKELYSSFHQLAETPHLGKDRSDIKAGYRSIPVKKHVIYYTVTESESFVNIIGVLHSRMDVSRQF